MKWSMSMEENEFLKKIKLGNEDMSNRFDLCEIAENYYQEKVSHGEVIFRLQVIIDKIKRIKNKEDK